jgi:hypothetical protein
MESPFSSRIETCPLDTLIESLESLAVSRLNRTLNILTRQKAVKMMRMLATIRLATVDKNASKWSRRGVVAMAENLVRSSECVR